MPVVIKCLNTISVEPTNRDKDDKSRTPDFLVKYITLDPLRSSLVLIGEIKATDEEGRFSKTYFKCAVRQVMDYCAMYFYAEEDAKSVLALVGSGACWQCHSFTRDLVPTLNPITCRIDRSIDKNIAKEKEFSGTFRCGEEFCHLLGTQESDLALADVRGKVVCSEVFQRAVKQ